MSLLAIGGYFIWHGMVAFYGNSVDGAFQNFNALDALHRGMVVGRDFTPYLGVGVTYVLYPFFLAFGGDFHAAQLAAHLVSFCFFVYSIWLLCVLAGVSRHYRLIVVVAVLALCLTSANFQNLLAPGNSLRGVRTVLPIVLAGLILWVDPRLTSRTRPFFWGGLAGIAILWSNDAGLPSAGLLLLALWVYTPEVRGVAGRVLDGALFLAAAAVTGLGAVWLVTGGQPQQWVYYNFVAVAGDQFWFFGPWEEFQRVFGLSDFLKTLVFPGADSGVALRKSVANILGALSVLVITWHVLRWKRNTLSAVLFAYVALSSVAIVMLVQVGGHRMAEYIAPLQRIGLFTVPFAAVIALRHRAPTWSRRAALAWSGGRIRQLLGGGVLLVFFAAVAGEEITGGDNIQRIKVPELGGMAVDALEQPAIEFFRAWRVEADGSGVPQEKRLFSSYFSTLDLVAGARPPGRYYSIIHALGESGRHDYLEALERTAPRYVTTINPAYSHWAYWNLRASWYFHRYLLRAYEPIKVFHQQIVWQRRTVELPRHTAVIECASQRLSENRVMLRVNLGGRVFPADGIRYAIDLELGYRVELAGVGLPLLGGRSMLTVTEYPETKLGARGLIQMRNTHPWRYGIDAAAQRWAIPVELSPGGSAQLVLEAFPSERARLDVLSCQGHVVAPMPAALSVCLPSANAPCGGEGLIAPVRTKGQPG